MPQTFFQTNCRLKKKKWGDFFVFILNISARCFGANFCFWHDFFVYPFVLVPKKMFVQKKVLPNIFVGKRKLTLFCNYLQLNFFTKFFWPLQKITQTIFFVLLLLSTNEDDTLTVLSHNLRSGKGCLKMDRMACFYQCGLANWVDHDVTSFWRSSLCSV